MGKIVKLPVKRRLKINPEKNSVIAGDCLEWLKYIPSKSVDVCYLDPPFFSNRNYEVIWGNGYELRAFKDRWKGGVKSYIVWMEERVKEIHRILKPTGSIFLHCDWHASHRLRVMLDDIFGENNFINEIIWCYSGPSKSPTFFPRKHDTIFFYSKKEKCHIFNLEKARIPYKRKKPSTGQGMASGNRTKEEIRKAELYWIKKGKVVEDYWNDIPSGSHISKKERIGYKTQKPESLIKRIIQCCSNENDTILDCFAGGGTTAAVAAKLGRRFITGDVSPVAVRVISKRLNKLTPPPF